MSGPLTVDEKAKIAELWRQYPGATATDLARIAARRLGRPRLGSQTVADHRPADLPAADDCRKEAGEPCRIGPREKAALAGARLGRPISKVQANAHRPTKVRRRPGAAGAGDTAPAKRPAPRVIDLCYNSPLADIITEAKRLRKRLMKTATTGTTGKPGKPGKPGPGPGH